MVSRAHVSFNIQSVVANHDSLTRDRSQIHDCPLAVACPGSELTLGAWARFHLPPPSLALSSVCGRGRFPLARVKFLSFVRRVSARERNAACSGRREPSDATFKRGA